MSLTAVQRALLSATNLLLRQISCVGRSPIVCTNFAISAPRNHVCITVRP